MSKIIKKIKACEYFSYLEIPDDWATLEEFADWYLNSKMPLMVPYNSKVFVTDDATAISIFRKGHYQVELYLIHPEMVIPEHSHPRMEVIQFNLGGGSLFPPDDLGVCSSWGQTSENLLPGNSHGGETGTILGDGFMVLTLERWENPLEITSAAIQWSGPTGPKQSKLIEENKNV